MTNFHPVHSRFRSVHAAAVLALVIGHLSFVIPVSAAATAVVAVQPTRVADLVLLDHGFDAGLRQGMVCRITRGSAAVADVLLVEVRPSCSAALITSVAAHQAIRAGDTASVKILKT